MPTNNKTQQPARPALSRKEIEEIATQAAYREVQRLLGDEQPSGAQTGSTMQPLALPESFVPEPPPGTIPVMTRLATGERRFTAHLPHVEGKDSQVTGTRNYATGHVVLDDAKGVYGSWEAFLKAYHEQGQTPIEIVMEG